jgi:hypothetical protein
MIERVRINDNAEASSKKSAQNAVHKPRGRPFKSGNPGRPLGSKNKVTQVVEQLAEGQAEQLIQKIIELAQAGDVSCLRMMLDRLWPPRKGQPVNIAMPPIKSSQDVFPAIASIWTAIREGVSRLKKPALCPLSSIAQYKQSSSTIMQSASQR